jgi:hypothetical protein
MATIRTTLFKLSEAIASSLGTVATRTHERDLILDRLGRYCEQTREHSRNVIA